MNSGALAPPETWRKGYRVTVTRMAKRSTLPLVYRTDEADDSGTEGYVQRYDFSGPLLSPVLVVNLDVADQRTSYRLKDLLEGARHQPIDSHERELAEGKHRDISEFGDWRAYTTASG